MLQREGRVERVLWKADVMVCGSSPLRVRHEVIEVKLVPSRHCRLSSRFLGSGGRMDIVLKYLCVPLDVYNIPTDIVSVVELSPCFFSILDLSLTLFGKTRDGKSFLHA